MQTTYRFAIALAVSISLFMFPGASHAGYTLPAISEESAKCIDCHKNFQGKH